MIQHSEQFIPISNLSSWSWQNWMRWLGFEALGTCLSLSNPETRNVLSTPSAPHLASHVQDFYQEMPQIDSNSPNKIK